MAHGFRTFDHTGDLGLEVRAETPEALYALAMEALMAQIADAGGDPPAERVELALEAADPEDLLVHWLNTGLLEADVRGALWTRARVTQLAADRLKGVLEGPRLDPARHVLLREIKAVSYHDLELRLTPGDCRCRLILDL